MNTKLLLAVICLLFLATRLYKIAEIPTAVYWDEASIGYNAYSVSLSGHDEWGKLLPLHFRAFGEFKLPVYIYTTAFFVKLFGLNEFSVRISSVIFSLGVVILTYLVAKKISESIQIGLWSSFFISITPWFFISSRTGFEATAGLMFYLLGIYLFLNLTKNYFLLLSIMSFIISVYSYNSFRIIVPLTIILLSVFEWKSMNRKMLKWIFFSALALSLSIIPIYRLYVYDAGFSRLQNIGSVTGVAFVKNYFSHFNPSFLFNSGDKNLRHQQNGFGQLYSSDKVLLLAGFIYLLKSKTKYRWLSVMLVLLGPIPAAITKESPHALRAISMIPFLSMISAMGVAEIRKYFKRRYLIELVVITVFLSFFIVYLSKFVNIYPAQSSKDWQAGYKQIYTGFKKDFTKYDHIVISDKYAQPYIFALFYLDYNPEKFRQSVIRNRVDQWGFSTVKSFNSFVFDKIKPANIPKGKNLIFASIDEILTGVPDKHKILNSDGSIAFYVYEYEK